MSGRFRRRYGFSGRRRFARANYRGSRYGSSARRSRGNMRAASQQNDISNVVINVMKKVKTGVVGLKIDGTLKEIGTAAINIFELLQKSEFYQSYSNMYDQFRINRIQVKATPVTWKTYDQYNLPNGAGVGAPVYEADTSAPSEDWLAGNSKYIVPQALTIITAWDRTGLDSTQLYVDDANAPTVAYTTIGDAISTYSSAKSSQLVAGANFNCVRYLYPSSQQEKSLYYSCSDLVAQIDTSYSAAQPWYKIKPITASWDSKNITNLQTDPTCPFKPTFLIGVLKVDDLSYPTGEAEGHEGTDPTYCKNKIHPVTFNLEFDIGVTFRGLRKAQVV